MLREQLGFDGVVCTDWELVNDNHVGDQVLPARAWGVEHLDPHERMERILAAGVDQFGGEECVDVLLDLVRAGPGHRVDRIDASARRLLAVKFRLGLFDDPFVDEDAAARTVGRDDFRAAGYEAQARSVTVLTNDRTSDAGPLLPLAGGLRIYAENVSREVGGAARHPRGPSGGRRRGARAADGAVRAALGPLPRVVVPRRLARLPAGAGRAAAADRRGTAGSSSTSCSTGPRCSRRSLPVADAVVASYGTSDDALLEALTAAIPPRGRLPFDLPRSMDQVRAHPEDVPGFDDPLFPFGHGLTI